MQSPVVLGRQPFPQPGENDDDWVAIVRHDALICICLAASTLFDEQGRSELWTTVQLILLPTHVQAQLIKMASSS